MTVKFRNERYDDELRELEPRPYDGNYSPHVVDRLKATIAQHKAARDLS